MSGTTSSWLQKQRKGDLMELADNYSISTEGKLKTDIESALDSYLSSHPELSSDSRVAPFYKRRSESVQSPVKRETSSTLDEAGKTVKSVKRRATKAAEEISSALTSALTDESEPEPATTRARSALTRTPRASALSYAQSVPLPPSPSVVVDAIDRRTAVMRGKVATLYEKSGVMEQAQATRETLSTVVSVEALIIAFEAYCLRSEVLADRYAFTIPALRVLGTEAHAVQIPDLFLLLTSSFWGPATLWAVTSFLVPLLASYFFNLTSKPRTGRSHTTHFHYSFDPLTFNIVKALLTYVVYAQDYTFGGLVDLEYVARINSSLVGGPSSVLVGCGIGLLVTFYEAIIKK
ncbi:MAG: hypothetical protein M1818_002737 [Claussenomyces sp. TS43310]|nr:MAG: hypothetical protein M1818_002737 [Claussenomyces sp. TS43310]